MNKYKSFRFCNFPFIFLHLQVLYILPFLDVYEFSHCKHQIFRVAAPPCSASGQASPTNEMPVSKDPVSVTCITDYSFANGDTVKEVKCVGRKEWDGRIVSYWQPYSGYGWSEEKCQRMLLNCLMSDW